MNADYAACDNDSCRLRHSCFRFMMKRSEQQCWGFFRLVNLGGSHEFCDGFSPTRKGDDLRDLRPGSPN